MARSPAAQPAQIVCSAPLLTVLLVKDEGRCMAKCFELDLVTERDTSQEVCKRSWR